MNNLKGVEVISGISGSWFVFAKNGSHLPGSNGTYVDAHKPKVDRYGVCGHTYVEVVRAGQVRERHYFKHETVREDLRALLCEVFQ